MKIGVAHVPNSVLPASPQTFDRPLADHNSAAVPVSTRRPEIGSLRLVRPGIHGTGDRRIGPEILLNRASEGILDSGASLDDAGDRDGPPIGRLPEGP
jgi:hypothetical protein